MKFPNGVNPADVLNGDNIFYRNPTHLEETSNAIRQSDIVKSIQGVNNSRKNITFRYDDPTQPVTFPGVKRIRQLVQDEDEDSLKELFSCILRVKPNVYMFRLSFGGYKDLQELKSREVMNVGSTSPIYHTDIAGRIAKLFARSNNKIVDFVFYIEQAGSNYRSVARAFETTKDQYEDDENFNPSVEVEYNGLF